MNFETDIQPFAKQPLTLQILLNLLKEYKWPHNKIRELEKKGLLTPLKRGLYITGPRLNFPRPTLALLANHIYGPSYVSMEAALAHWGMIPEKVTGISSMTTGLTRTFRTSLGRFSYIHTRLPYYCFGIRQVELSEQQSVLLASPEKALCDTIITRAGILLRSVNQTMQLLIDDFRMDKSALGQLSTKMIHSWINHAPKKNSLSMLVKTLDNL